MVFGDTSAGSPSIAAVFALAGNAATYASGAGASGFCPPGDPGLNKVVSGSNARHCSVYLCNAANSLLSFNGYNGPTGMGTPSGTAGF